MHCPECEETVCNECVGKYPDMGFALFCKKEDDLHARFIYRSFPECATKRGCENQYAAEVYALHEAFKDSDEHRQNLRKKIAETEKSVWGLRRKLAASEKILVPAKKDEQTLGKRLYTALMGGGGNTSVAEVKQCALHHPLEAGGGSVVCLLCGLGPVTMHCPKCNDGVCGECLVAYEDVGFAMFMCHEDRDNLEVYKKNPSTATRLYRDPWSAAVTSRHDEFINNDRHRVALQGKIERMIQNLEQLRVKLRKSEERAAAAGGVR
jgi:hypothetical protein